MHSFINQYGADEIVLKFIVLLNNIPFNLFRPCTDKDCQKWFASSRSDKQYCSTRCSNRARQRKLRLKDPEGYAEPRRKRLRDEYKKKCDDEREKRLSDYQNPNSI
ncbi:CGNR zinc finger domain-containing protein [Desulfobacula sp.]|uniref:CGNR zinc finger domain-containing protein n=1 Tax=Desulfobacula sp. TaxID=2593537 RepID=UPI00345B8102